MAVPVPTRFDDDDLRALDEMVAQGVAENRSAVIRLAVRHLFDGVRRERIGRSIADSYRRLPQTTTEDEAAMANALAMTEAEPW